MFILYTKFCVPSITMTSFRPEGKVVLRISPSLKTNPPKYPTKIEIKCFLIKIKWKEPLVCSAK